MTRAVEKHRKEADSERIWLVNGPKSLRHGAMKSNFWRNGILTGCKNTNLSTFLPRTLTFLTNLSTKNSKKALFYSKRFSWEAAENLFPFLYLQRNLKIWISVIYQFHWSNAWNTVNKNILSLQFEVLWQMYKLMQPPSWLRYKIFSPPKNSFLMFS